MLLTTFFIMEIGSIDYVQAVTQSTFAAFIGMRQGLLVLFYYLATTGLALLSLFLEARGSEGVPLCSAGSLSHYGVGDPCVCVCVCVCV